MGCAVALGIFGAICWLADLYPRVALGCIAIVFIYIMIASVIAGWATRPSRPPVVKWTRQPPEPELPPRDTDDDEIDEEQPEEDTTDRWPSTGFVFRRPDLLDLADCTSIKELPDDLKVNGGIDIAGTRITSLPPSLKKTQLFWRGVPITHRIAFEPESLTVDEVLKEQNTEVRRVMLERFPGGFERFMAKANAKTVDSDTDSGGERKLLKVPMRRDEDLVCLQVHCPSTGALYILRVPPTMETCRQAAAWVAGFDNPDDYKPLAET
jgi:hypothetical protein